MNTLDKILSLPTADPPAYASNPNIRAILRQYRIKVRWVDSTYGADLDQGNAPTGSFYDFGLLVITKCTKVESFIHELAHGLVAKLARPRSWRSLINFGCDSQEEELQTCHLQFYLLSLWNLWEEYSSPDPYRGLLMDYSFDMDLPDWESTEQRDVLLDRLWKRLVKKGSKVALKLDRQKSSPLFVNLTEKVIEPELLTVAP